MLRTDFHFNLPKELIAQQPAAQRSASRLLLLDGRSGARQDSFFRDLPSLLGPADLLVFNDTRVVPARLRVTKDSGGKIEILLERALGRDTALVHARASKGLKVGAWVTLPGGMRACMQGREGDLFRLKFSCEVLPYFERQGEMPLPPYIGRAPENLDRERYQTVYARTLGAVAAPTAGLHFDAGVFAELDARGVGRAFVTLHVGAGTFQPVRVDDIESHEMHEEYLEVPEATVAAINAARAGGGRIVAVGTTVVRSLEAAAQAAEQAGSRGAARGVADGGGAAQAPGRGAAGDHGSATDDGRAGRPGPLLPYKGPTRIFIKPGYSFRVVDAMITNFHLPESTLLMLCSAFVGRETLLSAYAHAVEARYRFFSYGDAMFLTPHDSAMGRP